MLIQIEDLDSQLDRIRELDSSLSNADVPLDKMWPLAEAVCEPLINPLPYLFNPSTWDVYADALGGRYEDGKLMIESLDAVWDGFIGLIKGCLQDVDDKYSFNWSKGSLEDVGNRLLQRSSLSSLDFISSDCELHYLMYVLFSVSSLNVPEFSLQLTFTPDILLHKFSSYWQTVLWFHFGRVRNKTAEYARKTLNKEKKPGKRRHALLLWWLSVIKAGGDMTAVADVTESMLDELAEPCEFRGSGNLPVRASISFSGRDPQEIFDKIKAMIPKNGSTIAEAKKGEVVALIEEMCGCSDKIFDIQQVRTATPLRVAIYGGSEAKRLQISDTIEAISGYTDTVNIADLDEEDTLLKRFIDAAKQWKKGKMTVNDAIYSHLPLYQFAEADTDDPAKRALATMLRRRAGFAPWSKHLILTSKNESDPIIQSVEGSTNNTIIINAAIQDEPNEYLCQKSANDYSPAAPITPEPPQGYAWTMLELEILEALYDHSYTLEDLFSAINPSNNKPGFSQSSVRDALRQNSTLRTSGKVANKLGLGYYRTDAPPHLND